MKSKNAEKGFLVPSGTVEDLPRWISDYPEFHRQVKAIRESRGMSQQHLAEGVGLTWRSIPNIESGKVNPKITTLEKIAEQLDCDLKILLIPRVKTGAPPPAAGEELSPKDETPDDIPPETSYRVEKKKEYFWD